MAKQPTSIPTRADAAADLSNAESLSLEDKSEIKEPNTDTGQPPPPEENPQAKIFTALFMDKDGNEWPKIEKIIRENLPQLVIQKLVEKNLQASYNILLFLDQVNSIGEDHADRIYNAVSSFPNKQDIMLIIGSKGGEIEPAYLISKNCRSSSKEKFVVCVPRRAKSAATLIALGANEIHMGAMSELGPIDPQLGQLPAMAMNNALDTIARLVSEHPKCSDMFAKYLESQLDLRILGYFKRINESAKQYATRLLQGKTLAHGFTPLSLAQHLVDHYNDHSFAIDSEEALSLFGDKMLRFQTPEYHASSEIDKALRMISNLCKWIHKKEVTFVGSVGDCLKVKDIKSDQV